MAQTPRVKCRVRALACTGLLASCASGGPKHVYSDPFAIDTATDTSDTASPHPTDIAVDADADGYLNILTGGDDCNDGNATVHPGATEVCDGIDNDCDRLEDDDDPGITDQPTEYEDADLDGFGNAAVSIATCRLYPGLVHDPSDCDDTDATVYPGTRAV